MSTQRKLARELADRAISAQQPLVWFEDLYQQAQNDASQVPWADLMPNPNLVRWLEREQVRAQGRTTLVVGCGLGDDAEALSSRGFRVTAFDISPTCIDWCHRRFPESNVEYVTADLLAAPPSWKRNFDFVVESYTLQVLPPALRVTAISAIAVFVAPGGLLLVVSRGREESDPEGEMPWPLCKDELTQFRQVRLRQEQFEDYMDDEIPPVRRFRVVYRAQ